MPAASVISVVTVALTFLLVLLLIRGHKTNAGLHRFFQSDVVLFELFFAGFSLRPRALFLFPREVAWQETNATQPRQFALVDMVTFIVAAVAGSICKICFEVWTLFFDVPRLFTSKSG